MRQLLQANVEVLQQLKDILQLLPEDGYCADSPLPASSIGKHTRHVLDHYLALQNGLNDKHIDYNQRNRASNIEFELGAALASLASIQTWLAEVTFDEDSRIDITSEISVSATVSSRCQSSIKRELAFLVNHTIHHVTFAALLAKSQDVVLSPHIGLAPSTASHLRDINEALQADG